MKVFKKLSTISLAILIACTLMIPFISTVSANAQYEIVFKGGLHGTLNNQSSVSYHISAGDLFPNEPTIQVEEGYVFTGWNKQLPAVGSKVDRKLVFVAKYDVLVDGISYIVRYVNENNEPIATPKSMMAEAGSKIVERAKIIPGYAFKDAQQQFVLSETNKEITFVYEDTDSNIQIRYEEEIINVGENTEGNNARQEGNQSPKVENKEEKEKEEINDKKDTPLAKGESNSNDDFPLIIGSFIGLGLLIIIIVMILKKQKKEIE